MDSKLELQIDNYLSDEDKLYQDWYTGLFETSEDAQYTTEVGIIPDRDKIKRFFEKWFNNQKDKLKKLCVDYDYCQKRQQSQQSSLIAVVADGVSIILGSMPVNVAALATILVAGKFLDRLCDCPKNEE
ncbi:MAG: hypothetical protein DRR16_07275 [Candidatus Parabeggiatoa sp. nov. 3]|nr:MAG: hypothetical protein DRR00_10405 [Gammaproteobacteria bacterium]RKZ65106.1 MAG: hypothetical protein DRQ99_13600 [Gammaproteobacteria bacterium]RKZ87421.1 MAG: hypothetical protein DRR16_07275 [Gammaproteobacteria bacterium]